METVGSLEARQSVPTRVLLDTKVEIDVEAGHKMSFTFADATTTSASLPHSDADPRVGSART